jgi:hypothetical protein
MSRALGALLRAAGLAALTRLQPAEPGRGQKNGRTRRCGQVIREETPKWAKWLCPFAALHASHEMNGL